MSNNRRRQFNSEFKLQVAGMVRELKADNDILKKASAFFARELK